MSDQANQSHRPASDSLAKTSDQGDPSANGETADVQWEAFKKELKALSEAGSATDLRAHSSFVLGTYHDMNDPLFPGLNSTPSQLYGGEVLDLVTPVARTIYRTFGHGPRPSRAEVQEVGSQQGNSLLLSSSFSQRPAVEAQGRSPAPASTGLLRSGTSIQASDTHGGREDED